VSPGSAGRQAIQDLVEEIEEGAVPRLRLRRLRRTDAANVYYRANGFMSATSRHRPICLFRRTRTWCDPLKASQAH